MNEKIKQTGNQIFGEKFFKIRPKIFCWRGKTMKRFYIAGILVFLAFWLVSCRQSENQAYRGFALTREKASIAATGVCMDTDITVRLYDTNDFRVLQKCVDVLLKFDSLLSVTDEASEVYMLNHRTENNVEISSTLSDLLSDCLWYSSLTDGAFDVTIYPIGRLWGFTTPSYRVPEEGEISDALYKVGYRKVKFDHDNVLLEDGMMLDFGAVAKGYASEILKEKLIQNGVSDAVISLGGNVVTLGSKSGEKWRVAIQDPSDTKGYVGVLLTTDAAVVTSGCYQRNFSLDGVLYHHILDPKTGYPAQNQLVSVTVIGTDAEAADALSTAFFVMGYEASAQFLKQHPELSAIFVTSENEVFYTRSLDENFSFGQKSEKYDFIPF